MVEARALIDPKMLFNQNTWLLRVRSGFHCYGLRSSEQCFACGL
jgi:hypothetical protein